MKNKDEKKNFEQFLSILPKEYKSLKSFEEFLNELIGNSSQRKNIPFTTTFSFDQQKKIKNSVCEILNLTKLKGNSISPKELTRILNLVYKKIISREILNNFNYEFILDIVFFALENNIEDENNDYMKFLLKLTECNCEIDKKKMETRISVTNNEFNEAVMRFFLKNENKIDQKSYVFVFKTIKKIMEFKNCKARGEESKNKLLKFFNFVCQNYFHHFSMKNLYALLLLKIYKIFYEKKNISSNF